MIILIHSSKTMKPRPVGKGQLRPPELLDKARQLDSYLKTLSLRQIRSSMHLSGALASKTASQIAAWTDNPDEQSVAVDSFVGDIYSGLQVQDFTETDRQYADRALRILSGLYGIIRPLDGIYPYRLEMGYRLPKAAFSNLYKFWGDSIAGTLPAGGLIINASAEEYSKAVLPYVDEARVVTPRFLTKDSKTGEAKFVVVHSKIARGAYAHWVVKNQIEDTGKLPGFNELNYSYDKKLSTPASPVYICQAFGGLGLSVRLK